MRILKKKKIEIDNIVLDVFINFSKIRTRNPPKRPQSAANYVEGVEYRQLHVWILTSHDSSQVTSIRHDAWLTNGFP